MTRGEKRAFEDAQRHHYLEVRDCNSKAILYYYRACLRADEPYVAFYPRTRYARVEVDLLTIQRGYERRFTPEGREVLWTLFERETACRPGAWFDVSSERCWSRMIPVERAREVATALYAIATNPRYAAKFNRFGR